MIREKQKIREEAASNPDARRFLTPRIPARTGFTSKNVNPDSHNESRSRNIYLAFNTFRTTGLTSTQALRHGRFLCFASPQDLINLASLQLHIDRSAGSDEE
ncbi:hypothetical protein CHELA1G11_12478 [Hyphomicrobiales bacterium]|nr:hypothetical protein CHELA1G2_11827 [Hyphomicrobiales bacterium]CAH1665112.1 hypothetical protein CHELA1G11_12478 [Hyphomicrobiales bacterium]